MMPASRLLLIRPSAFGYNPETAETNVFQRKPELSDLRIQQNALTEFENMVNMLEASGVELYVFDDPFHYPDSVFPNNWVSFHDDGTVVLYPMMAESRRKERRTDILESLRKDLLIQRIVDLSHYEAEGIFLEGTGSVVFDHKNKLAFAARSARTDEILFHTLCKVLKYNPVVFISTDQKNIPLYHTNVIMTIADDFAIICSETIKDEKQRNNVLHHLSSTGKKIIEITYQQMERFAGNGLFICSKSGNPYLLISEQASQSLNKDQKNSIKTYCEIISPGIQTIEKAGGGSVRCMVSEILLPYL
jgi:hypothetical protein